MREELGISVSEESLEFFYTFYASAAGEERKTLRMDVFLVKDWKGDPRAASEIEEIAWVNSFFPETMKIGSIFKNEVIPRLKKLNLID